MSDAYAASAPTAIGLDPAAAVRALARIISASEEFSIVEGMPA